MTKKEKICIKWLNERFNNMELFYMEKYPEYIFHMKNGKCILQHSKKNGYVYVSYREIWKFFETVFSMSNQEIRDITKIWVEEHYRVGLEIRKCVITDGEQLAEEEYRKITTTKGEVFWLDKKVEEQYKMGLTSTDSSDTVCKIMKRRPTTYKQAEEHYKFRDTIIVRSNGDILYKAEDQYQEILNTNNQNQNG